MTAEITQLLNWRHLTSVFRGSWHKHLAECETRCRNGCRNTKRIVHDLLVEVSLSSMAQHIIEEYAWHADLFVIYSLLTTLKTHVMKQLYTVINVVLMIMKISLNTGWYLSHVKVKLKFTYILQLLCYIPNFLFVLYSLPYI